MVTLGTKMSVDIFVEDRAISELLGKLLSRVKQQLELQLEKNLDVLHRTTVQIVSKSHLGDEKLASPTL